jgi:cytochrome oxidase Cu insertion factor (SCO1/SenC/PrrC family)
MQARIFLGAAIALAVAGAGFFVWYQLVKAGVLHTNKYDRRQKGVLSVGGLAPDLALTMYDGTPMRLAELWGTRPVLLVFGSCT